MAPVTKDTHPEYFYEGSPINSFDPNNGLLTANDYSEIVLTDNSSVAGGSYISIEVSECNELTLPSG